ncbi:Surfeit locus protein 6 [Pelomyxa schiedti]|nr:Surfeit locus protein 6 [Pelomyxa schiedti]
MRRANFGSGSGSFGSGNFGGSGGGGAYQHIQNSRSPHQARFPAREAEYERPKSTVIYNALDFGDKPDDAAPNTPKRAKPKKLLQKALATEKKLRAMPEEERRAEENKMEWNKAIKKSKGERVYESTGALMRKVNKDLKQKVHSAKKWAERDRHLQESMAERQQARTQRVTDKKTSSTTKSPKKPNNLRRPGFEGKRRQFLNR